MKSIPKFCKRCKKILRDYNKSGYCDKHRYLSESFKESRRKAIKKWRQSHKEESKIYMRNYTRNNKDKIKIYSKNYYQRHKPEIIKRNTIYYQNNKDKVKITRHKYYLLRKSEKENISHSKIVTKNLNTNYNKL